MFYFIIIKIKYNLFMLFVLHTSPCKELFYPYKATSSDLESSLFEK